MSTDKITGPDDAAATSDQPPAPATVSEANSQDALNRALDDVLDQIDRARDVDLSEELEQPRDGSTPRALIDRQDQRAGLRTVLSSVSARVMAERTTRAAEAAVAAAEARRQAAETIAAEDREQLLRAQQQELQRREMQRPGLHPFRTGFLGGLGLLLAYVTYLSLDSIRSTLIVIAVAALLAIGLDPAVGVLVRRGIKRGFAVAMVFLIVLGVLAGAVYAIIPPIVTEVTSFVASVPKLIQNLQNNPSFKGLDDKYQILQKLKDSSVIQQLSTGAAGGLVTVGVTVAGIAADLFVVLILSLFFLAGFPNIKAGAYRLAPASKRLRVTELGDKILKQMGGYLAGATLVAFQAGVVAGVFSAIVGLPYPWAIGLGAAVLDFVPVIGPIIVGVSITLIGFTQSLTIGIVAGGFYLCQHLFEGYWLYPRVMRRQVDISTGAVVVAILIGGALLGVTGALLAVPVAAAVQLIIREVLMPRQERR